MAEENNLLVKEISRRRVYIFFASFIFIAFGLLIREEADQLTHVLDEYFLTGGSLLILVLSWYFRKTKNLKELIKQHNIFAIIVLIMLFAQLFAFPAEIRDPQDFGNEIPSLIILIVLLTNRFI